QEGYLLLLAHVREPVLQSQLPVFHAAGVKKSLRRQAAHPDPLCQFLLRGIVLHNVPVLERDSCVLQVFFGPSACAAFWIFNKKHVCLSPFCLISALCGTWPPARPRSRPRP